MHKSWPKPIVGFGLSLLMLKKKIPLKNPQYTKKLKSVYSVFQLTYCQKKTLIQEITSESREYNLPETFEEKKLRLINLSGTQFLMRELNGLIVSTGTY